MLITSDQLYGLHELSSMDILDNSVYLTESESVLNPIAVPVIENVRLGCCTVYYKDIEKVSEDYGISEEDALYSIAEEADVDVNDIAVAIDESKIILNPSIAYEFPNHTIIRESDYSIPSVFVEACLSNYIWSGLDEDYLAIMCNPEVLLEKGKPKVTSKFLAYQDGKVVDTRTGKEVKVNKKTMNALKLTAKKNNNTSTSSGGTAPESPKPNQPVNNNNTTGNNSNTSGTAPEAPKPNQSTNNGTNNNQSTEQKVENVKDTAETINDNNHQQSQQQNQQNSANNQTQPQQQQNTQTTPQPTTTQQQKETPQPATNNPTPTPKEQTPTTGNNNVNNAPNPQNPSFMTQVSRMILNKPRDFLAKMAAKLRMAYRAWMRKAAQEEKSGNAPWYKKIARKIMQAVDYIMKKIQNARSEGYGRKVNDPNYYQPGRGRRTANRA